MPYQKFSLELDIIEKSAIGRTFMTVAPVRIKFPDSKWSYPDSSGESPLEKADCEAIARGENEGMR